jgi:ComF family protein
MGSVRECLTDLTGSMLNVVFPPLCILCENALKETGLVCPGCLDGMERLPEPLCERCGAPLRTSRDSCICSSFPTEIEKIRSSVFYEGVAKDIMHFYKFKGYWSLSSLLAGMMRQDALALVGGEKEVVVMGVPLHRVRERERGYDQARMLAVMVSSRIGLPTALGAVQRRRHTRPQAELSLEERKENLHGAFSVKDASKFEGRTVLLVDDVLTTGVTMGYCGRVLKAAGARSVLGLTFARRMRMHTSTQGE